MNLVKLINDIRIYKIKKDLEVIHSNLVLLNKYENYYDIKIELIKNYFFIKKFKVDDKIILINKSKRIFHLIYEKFFHNKLQYKKISLNDYITNESKVRNEKFIKDHNEYFGDSFICLTSLNLKYDYDLYILDIKKYVNIIINKIERDMKKNKYSNLYVSDINFNIDYRIGKYKKTLLKN